MNKICAVILAFPVTMAIGMSLFMVQGAIHQHYVHIEKFEPAYVRWEKATSYTDRGKAIDDMLDAMDEGNDFLWFTK